MIITGKDYMGELVLHPTHWLFGQKNRPICPECGREIVPLQPITTEDLPGNKIMFRHAECAAGGGNDQPL